MMPTYLTRGLVLGATLLLGSTAQADPPAHANAGGKPEAKVEAKADKAEAKAEAKADKAEAKAAAAVDKADKAGADQKNDTKPSDRAARRTAQKEKLRSALKGPMDEAVKQELRRHAERVAKLERIRALAVEAKDDDAAARASKLLEKETARHEKFMTTRAKVEAAPGTAAKADDKGGAK